MPMVSILLPVRNEGGFIRETIRSLLEQDHPADQTEIIVADGYSTDDTVGQVEALIREFPQRRIRVIPNPERIFSTGFNRGLAASEGEFILMMGGHARLAPNYISACLSHLLRDEADCVGGFVETLAVERSARAIAEAMSSPFGLGGVAFRTRPVRPTYADTVGCGLYRRTILARCGSVDESMVRNQDDELNYRIRKMGGRILLIPTTSLRYFSRTTIRALWKQYFHYGFWKVRVLQKHPLQMRARHFAPATFVLMFFAAALTAPFFSAAAWLFCLIAGSYGAACLGFAALASRTPGLRIAVLLPPVFWALHFSYGTGFLMGLIRFAFRWRQP